jgi:hypothetical protein
MILYYVEDKANELCSKFYETKEEAEKDLKKDISHRWSFEAKIREVYVK